MGRLSRRKSITTQIWEYKCGSRSGGWAGGPRREGRAVSADPGRDLESPPGAIGRKPQNTLATINRLLAYIGRDRLKVLFVFACVW